MSILKHLKRFKVLVLALIVLLFSYLGYRYYETPTNTKNVKTEASFTVDEFLTILTTNSDKDLKKYIEKGIEIRGIIKEITNKQKIYTLTLGGGQNSTFIICEMQLDETIKVQRLKVGELVTVKGVYKGILNDAILLNCLIV